MIVTLHLFHPEALAQEDGLLANGWFSIETRGLTLRLFDDRGCELFSTAGYLFMATTHLLRGQRRRATVLAVDYGATLRFSRRQDQLVIRNGQFTASLNLREFAQALVAGAQQMANQIAAITSAERDARLDGCLDDCQEALRDALAATTVSASPD
jgi:hypothetical protein